MRRKLNRERRLYNENNKYSHRKLKISQSDNTIVQMPIAGYIKIIITILTKGIIRSDNSEERWNKINRLKIFIHLLQCL